MKSIASAIRGLSLVFCAVLLIAGSLFISAAPASADTVKVIMGGKKGLVFEPAVVNVKAGDTIQFEVGQLPPHNVVFDKVPGADAALAASLSHKALEGAKKTFDITIPADAPKGEYSYFCLPHRGAGMVGKVVVQ
ncbi:MULTISPECIES: plastocyanin [Leptolyngbya]|jgi:plastocyanin|uniref:Plastocyanin n=2 Tax=Leptolyngbya boryana TaxID=1184 RepID=A0A1Z4JQN2_LEPBY|nr:MULTISPECIES: plastocyanin [Leptolyngbya]BAY59085.1 plastocyanin [Leptolyngbya boryana NIES-2135]MBD1857064.1 plastocyanin [Leptolyngbya sp. FACHB-1624]MBD2368168.1 plastocyanin [Leptolyngbya sp. FACHB-161]MBD2374795.1 plastocyanin [Leptolyngbya sp. FACHB-238]MBD2399217.1 plastocyanin [Leptolyngbya sp. FACHB-239]